MELKELRNKFSTHPQVKILKKILSDDLSESIRLKGLSGSSYTLVASSVISDYVSPVVFVVTEREEAAYLHNDLERLCTDRSVLFFPSSYKHSLKYAQYDTSNAILRTEVLNKIASKIERLIIVTYADALIEKVINKENIAQRTLILKRHEQPSMEFVMEMLYEYGFERTDFVYEPGQFAVRGSIIDIFSYTSEFPHRIDFFGDTVESIRSFNVEDQLSKDDFETISILPDIGINSGEASRESFFDYLPDNTLVWIRDGKMVVETLDQLCKEMDNDIAATLCSSKEMLSSLKKHRLVEEGQSLIKTTASLVEFNTIPQPSFNKNFKLLGSNLLERHNDSYLNLILSDSEKQIQRLHDIFNEIEHEVNFDSIVGTIHAGFIDQDLRICCYTDHQIFERYHRYQIKGNFSRADALTLKDLTDLHPGDFVVHIDHGIGVFAGLERIDVNGKIQESIRLVYQDKDVLYVSIHNLHRISKYRGKDGGAPKLYKLGSGAWDKLKQNTKKKVKDIARDLILLYAKRKTEQGFAFSADNYLQRELEASFIYEDTPDQEKTTREVKEGMELSYPMDRLVCGDVGFGKTEIAIRAAFKAVCDSKQVAILVPTTVLAYQHYNTFKERLKNFPCTVEYVSRFRTAKEIKETLKKLKEGKVDILIGTHRIVSKDVEFRDLGLFIIDEEQKFGVATKEKIRQMKVNVDTLTLTATPIPRTLHFSLMGARDLSVINTPPPNRHPINTEVHPFNEHLIREAILYEVNRGGQVFFINNRIANLVDIEVMIHKLCPGVRTTIGHGQLTGERLEEVMLGFIEGNFDVLISTAIIESGLDIPNANTIIINHANHFGLSDLHQLRGRVGRSNRKAFCYLLAPPLSTLTQDARLRLRAIEELSDLGSGFNISMQDLDIRGAGNLVGAEQSGYIEDIGIETYQRILEEAIRELKESEYKDVFYPENEKELEDISKFLNDCQVDTDLEILFPEKYVNSAPERLRLYKRLDVVSDETELQEFRKELVDRFGPLPNAAEQLLEVIRLRRFAMNLGFEKIVLKNKKLILYFIANQSSLYFQSAMFARIIAFVQHNPRVFNMKEANGKLTLIAENVNGVVDIHRLLSKMN